jgi:MFS family permease
VEFSTYADFARNQVVRRILVLGLLIRIPLWAAGVVLTLHVVGHLDRSYTQAGLVEMVLCIALAVSGPWRGRRLDRIGLRATVTPSLVVLAVTWSIAPWVGYWALLAFVGLAGLFVVPTFSIVRQVLIGAVPEEQRTAVLSLDSVVVEFSFMIGPVIGVLAATYLPTSVALMACQLVAVAGALVLWIDNPPLTHETPEAASQTRGEAAHEPVGEVVPRHHLLRDWLSPSVVTVLALSVAATVILTGEDLGTVAALRSMDHTTSIGWVLARWGLGSAIGGILYGAPTELPNIKHRKEYEAGLERLPDYRITCFFVDKNYRRRRVAEAALHGALDLIARAGGGTVEAYPQDTGGKKITASFLYSATRSLFEQAGFGYDRPKGKNHCVMSSTVKGARGGA